MSFRFKVAPRASAQIRTAAEWWLKNRTKTPAGFAEDLEAAFSLIQELPNAGEPVPHPAIPNVRRVLLGLSQHHLYYSVSAEESVVEVLALWHTSRGSAPRLQPHGGLTVASQDVSSYPGDWVGLYASRVVNRDIKSRSDFRADEFIRDPADFNLMRTTLANVLAKRGVASWAATAAPRARTPRSV